MMVEKLDEKVRSRAMRGHDSPTVRDVLTILRRVRRPLSAYDLLHRLEDALDRKVAPPTVYRALEALLGQGLVARIESRSAYVVTHVGHTEDCVFFVCDRCNTSLEIEDPDLQVLISKRAKSFGFQVKHRVVEMTGLCGRCQESVSLPRAS